MKTREEFINDVKTRLKAVRDEEKELASFLDSVGQDADEVKPRRVHKYNVEQVCDILCSYLLQHGRTILTARFFEEQELPHTTSMRAVKKLVKEGLIKQVNDNKLRFRAFEPTEKLRAEVAQVD